MDQKTIDQTELDLLKYFSSIKQFLTTARWDKVEEAISEGLGRSIITRQILRGEDGVDEAGISKFVLETYAPPYFDFSYGGSWLSEEDAQTRFLILPNENLTKKGLTEGLKSVESPPVETETTKGKEIMQTIKESAVKTKDQVIKTAIGQAGVAGIKSLILTALPMKIGFIGRLLGRHKAVANNSLVVAGIAILANQAGQKYITNEAARNALQATQDQAVTEVLNEYVGIENQIQRTVSKTLDLESTPVTVDQQD